MKRCKNPRSAWYGRLTVERIDLFQISVGTVTALDLDVDKIFPKS